MGFGQATPSVAGLFYEQGGAALRGYDPVAYFTESKPVKGSPQHQADYRGTLFRFATVGHREAFLADPETYAPQYGGFCAFGVAKGYKAATDPAAFTIVDGRLYLNDNLAVQRAWRKDVPGYVRQADGNWPKVERTTKVIE